MLICSPLSTLQPSVPLYPPKIPKPLSSNPISFLPKTKRNFKNLEPHLSPISVSTPPNSQLTPTRKLKQLIKFKDLVEAKALYFENRNTDVKFGIVLESMLIDGFMKSGWVSDAFRVFEEMPKRNVVTWTSMISGCVRNGFGEVGFSLFVEMLESNVVPNDFAFSAALQACADLSALLLGEQLHSLTIKYGLHGDCRIRICLIHFYSKCGSMDKAVQVFDQITRQDLVSFTSIISGFCTNGFFDSAVEVFGWMVREGVQPNEHTVSSILTACGSVLGEQIHGYMIKTMIDRSVYSSSALMELYSRNGKLDQAEVVFDKIKAKNVVAWSSMISCYVRNDQVQGGLKLFHEMVSRGIEPNEFTFAIVIGACGLCLESIRLGQQLHCLVIKLNLVLENRILNAVITMYARNGEVEDVEKVFARTQGHDVASWCAAISGYFQNGLNERSMRLLCEMHRKGYIPNEYGFSSVLSSCANLALLDQGRHFHCLALKLGCDVDVCMGNALVNMYAKCGCLNDARLAFDVMPIHDIMSWNSMIHGYAHHGHAREALRLFHEMESSCFVPDHSTFVAVLVACSHMGYVDEALKYFEMMSDCYDVLPSSSHYSCLVNMVGRTGRLCETLRIIEEMPFEPDILIWKTLLGSCRLHRNLELGKLAAEKVIELSPQDSASYVLLSNLHAMHGEWGNAERVRMTMEERGVKKDAGRSWIEVRSEVHVFVAKDECHPSSETIYQRLKELFQAMKDEGYSVDTGITLSLTLGD